MNLKEAKERNDLYQKILDSGLPMSGEDIHRDRAYLLGLVEEAKKIIEEFQDGMESENGDRLEEADEWLAKLESEAGE